LLINYDNFGNKCIFNIKFTICKKYATDKQNLHIIKD
jgi:hypothetical protein